jgi:hypothetical protein
MRHFQEKETKATTTKTERSGTTTTQTEGQKKKTEERKTDTPSRKAIFLTGILPPSFGEHNLQKQKTTNPDQQTENKKKACLRNLKVNSHHNKN